MVAMKLFLIASLVCFTNGDIQAFLGGWLPAMSFPDSPMMPICDRLYIDLDSSTCICNGITVAVTTARGYESPFAIPIVPLKFPTLVANTPDDVSIALSKTCECDGQKRQQIVFRKINDNCFVQYERHSGRKYTEKEPNHANLLVKKAPKTVKELEEQCKVEDLKDRSGHLACPMMFS